MCRIIILFVFFLPCFCFAQHAETNYRITLCGRPQTLVLNKDEKGKTNGYLEYKFYQSKKRRSRERKQIFIKRDLADSVSQQLVNRLESDGINSLTLCKDDEECNSIQFLDGDYLLIEIRHEDNKPMKFEYVEIYPVSEINGRTEKTDLRRGVQNLLTGIDEMINFKKQFSDVVKQLDNKYYHSYFSGISYVTIRKR